MKPTIAVVGATASGKSAFAVELGRALGKAVIINCDAMQLYNQCQTLTAQPSSQLQRQLPHRLYGVLSPNQQASAAAWSKLARREIQKARAKGCYPIVVGGSGFYLRALWEGLSPTPAIAPHHRSRSRSLDTAEAFKTLKALDPATTIAATDSQRVARALEVVLATGKPITHWQNKLPAKKLEGRKLVIRLEVPRQRLERTTSRRLAKIATTALREVARLKQHFNLRDLGGLGDLEKLKDLGGLKGSEGLWKLEDLEANNPLLKACGVREFEAVLTKGTSLADATAKATDSTYGYIQQQLTWLKHQPPRAKLIVRHPSRATARLTARLIQNGKV